MSSDTMTTSTNNPPTGPPTHPPVHWHIHYGDATEIEENSDIPAILHTMPPRFTLEQTLNEVIDYLIIQRRLVIAESVTSLDAFRNIKDGLDLFGTMTPEHVKIIEQSGLEVEIEEGLSVSVIPCDLACEVIGPDPVGVL